MLTEKGSVIAVESDGLWVETLKKSTCGNCQARHGCGQRLLANANPDMSYIKALFPQGDDQKNWRVGEAVIIGIDENTLMKATLISYLVPLALTLLGIAGGSMAFGSELAGVIGALAGLFVGGFIVKRYSRSLERKPSSCFHAKVLSHICTQ